jgi:uncharacterized damage-inducible protein DinB
LIDSQMIAELLTYSDWARERLMAPISGLAEERLDGEFEIGPGSLRATLRHIYFAERLWAQRLDVPGWQKLPPADSLEAVAEVAANDRALVQAYCTWLRALPADALARPVAYVDLAGRSWTAAVGDALLQACNHGVHHRAQAVNMLRAIGRPLPRPGIDYIFMRMERESEVPAAEIGGLRRFFAYGDWATGRMMAAAASLSGEQLDRPFEIGMGTLRATLRHIRDAEQWWLVNWTRGPEPFPAAQDRPAVEAIRAQFEETAARRNEFLSSLSGVGALSRTITARPRADMSLLFPLGVTMLQVCVHGTHHRAQALNMLRRLGGPTPGLDYIGFARATASN